MSFRFWLPQQVLAPAFLRCWVFNGLTHDHLNGVEAQPLGDVPGIIALEVLCVVETRLLLLQPLWKYPNASSGLASIASVQ